MDGGSARGGQHDSLSAEHGRQVKAAVSARNRLLGRLHASFMAREQELHCLQVLTHSLPSPDLVLLVIRVVTRQLPS